MSVNFLPAISLTSIAIQPLPQFPQTSANALQSLQMIKSIKEIPVPLTSLEFIDATLNEIQGGENNSFWEEENSLQMSLRNIQESHGSADLSKKGCICKKTKCLKMYCECFSNNRKCTSECQCYGCENHEENEERIESLRKALIDKKALKGNKLLGCNCRKSQCQKKYCECFNAKRQCSEYCRCYGCKNQWGVKPETLNDLQCQ